jgi:hypothetical protein
MNKPTTPQGIIAKIENLFGKGVYSFEIIADHDKYFHLEVTPIATSNFHDTKCKGINELRKGFQLEGIKTYNKNNYIQSYYWCDKEITFSEWYEVVTSLHCFDVSRLHTRDVYVHPKGVFICEDVIFGGSLLAKTRSHIFLSLALEKSKENKALAKKYKGKLVEDPYSDGKNMIYFEGKKDMENAYNFITEYVSMNPQWFECLS